MAQNLTINGVTYSSVSSLSIPKSGGGNATFPDTSDATAVAADLLSGKTAYAKGVKVTGNIQSKSAQTYTPTTSNQTISSGQYLSGAQTVLGDPDLVAGNIKKDVDIFGVIGTLESGGGGTPEPVSVPAKDVNFYDYDGRRVYAYTIAEAQALEALPAQPTHDGLTGQGWNYTLAEVNATTGNANIGATYIPTDGKTHLTINIAEYGRQVVPLYFNQTVSNGVTIDWGDGSLPETLTGTENRNTTHTYSAAGTYDITLDVTSGNLRFGADSYNYCVLGSTSGNGRVYCNMLKSVRIGNSVTTIGNYAFYYCHSLASVTIPNSVIEIGTYAFSQCYSLASVIIPNSVTEIGTYAFFQCYSLASVIIPNSVTEIGDRAFYQCYSLASVIIPNSVTEIGDHAFYQCYGMAHYYVYSTTPPTLGGTNVFGNIPADCVIHVPAASLSVYRFATNWSAHSAKMVGDL